MAYRYTDVNTRLVYDKSKTPFNQAGKIVRFWADAAGTDPIDVGLWSANTPDTLGASIGTNQLTVQSDSMWPAMWDRDGVLDHMWIQIGTPASPGQLYLVYCDADQRIDSLAADVQAASSAASAASSAAMAAGSTASAASTAAATAQSTANARETPSGAQSKADAAQAAAVASAAADATAKAAAAQIAATSAYVNSSKNLYNKNAADVQPGYTLGGGLGGTPVASASYTATGYVQVIPGQTYTLSNPRNWAFYDASQVFITGSAGSDATQVAKTLVAPAGAAYVRASYATATYGATFQIEKNGSATSYAPYGRTLVGVTVPETLLPDLTPDRATFVSLSKNLANPNEYDTDKVLESIGGTTIANTAYKTTGYIKVKAGQTYTLSNPRSVAFYDSSKTYQGSGSFVSVGSSVTAPVTAPVDGYLRASFVYASYETTFQIEAGSSATSYTPYAVTIPSLAPPKAGAISVTKSGNVMSVNTDMTGQTLTQTMSLSGSSNGAFTWTATSLAGIARHSVTDSVTPVRTTLGTVGGNHGFATVRSFTNPDAKTTADLGSRWTDGTTTYTLLQINAAGKLILGGPSTVDGNGVVTTVAMAPTADLTHVGGATKTGTILLSTIGAAFADQLYPVIRAISVRATLDNSTIPNGTSTGDVLRIVETYEILDYADLITKMQANVGVPHTSLTIAGALRLSNTFEMRAPGTWLISSAVTALTKQTLGQCGFIQSEVMNTPAGGSVWRWLPGVGTLGGFNWHAGVDITSYSANLLVTSAELMDTSKPPTWSMDWARASDGSDVLGFAHGYIPDKTNGSWASRVAAAPSQYWDLRSTKKSYPTTITTKTLLPGERLSIESFRAYLDPASPLAFAVQDAQGAYGFVRATGVTGQPAPLPRHLGRGVTPLLQQGLTVGTTYIDAEGLVVTGTGAAVTKLT